MKNLVSTAFVLALASQAAGCIIIDDTDEESTHLDVTWRMVSGTQTATCRPDTDAATLWVCPGDCPDINAAKGDVFTCANLAGSVPAGGDPALAYLPGSYTVWMEFSDRNKQVYAKSFSQKVSLEIGRFDKAHFDVQVDHGFFDLQWILTRRGAELPCPSAGSTVGLETTLVGAGGAFDKSTWPCNDKDGRTNPIKANAQGYVSKLYLDNSNAASLDKNVPPFKFGNEAQNLGLWMIEVP